MTTETAEARPRRASRHGVTEHGLNPGREVHWNLSPAELYEAALSRDEGRLAHGGGFAAVTAPHTGRSPKDKFTVRESSTEDEIDWGDVNVPLSPESYRALREHVVSHLNQRELFVRDARAGADPEHGINVRVVTESAWHSLFAYNMFLRPSLSEVTEMEPDFTVLHAPGLEARPEEHGTRSSAFIVVNFGEREVLIGGTRYAGEIKKSIFSVLNYLLPDRGVLPMHCSANVGHDGDVALFFGLSGTGKTTLSADPERGLIGDDEHGWSDHGVFNFEGGCYAKAIRLSPEGEPEIYRATQMFGTILENVILDEETREIDFDDASITENTRASYPIHYIPNAVIPGRGGHPRNVIFLTADAFGVLPPISRLEPAQAMYHFLSGYTAKVAGTERGVTEPKATFSACFGAPFLPRHPAVYAELLGEKLREHGARVWLVNTGWTAGPYGTGHRMDLTHTRAMVRAALAGKLDDVETERDPVFGIHVPVAVPDVPSDVLRPRGTWDDPEAYDAQAEKLAGMFRENFEKYASEAAREIREAGPTV
ncbi:MAG: phosphoenolpyruvate carboxykinase [Gemmatimonadetes bacterium]|nr:phosphoenolpyruvate carboxykinase [Gemmatimonadota bacterium]NIR79120.1 phosphoenolpyruvate carboxykinase [Gemmatimonadota bacterium]NIT87773.1 phosphoenolpyruvate carboxykinase [Gemmatimonadota bacterium]NIU31636.1 phosphoenolpyruvate carboxykinase [Gemmatimonadota bacterium]NIU36263.1 phosphoenolpyruvate carboxykinase [Gemmatimonadota bacterium]